MKSLRALLARPEAALFVLIFGVYAYFYQAGGFNQNSRFDLTRAMVEQGTFCIDSMQENAGDKSYRAGHYYSDKAPGSSLLALPAYALVYQFADRHPPSEEFLNFAAYLVTLWTLCLPSALAALALFALGGFFGMTLPGRAVLALAASLGTLAFPFSNQLFGHQLVAAQLIGAFWLLARVRLGGPAIDPKRNLFFAGLLLGFAFMTEYSAALAIAVLAVYALSFVRPLQRYGWFVAGTLPPLIALLLYQTDAFGGPLVFPYAFSTQVHRHMGLLMGLVIPSRLVLGRLLFGPYRGLFYSAPWLIAALPGAALFIGNRRFRAEGITAAAIALLIYWLNASLIDWEGGWTFGPRYLVPALPFLSLLALGLAPSKKGLAATAFWTLAGALIVYSMAMMFVGTSVQPQMDIRIDEPFPLLWWHFLEGRLSRSTHSIDRFGAMPLDEQRYAWNLGQRIGLQGLTSLLPLAGYVLATGAWLLWTLKHAKLVSPPRV